MLAFLEKLASGFWNIIFRVFALFMPFLRQRTWFRGIGKAVYWTLHIILLIAVLIALYWLNDYLGLDEKLKVSERWWFLRHLWLPILFMLIYVLGWLGWWLWKLLGPEEESAEFPDIDAAWDEAVYTLNQAGIDLTEAPLFVVLGRTAEPEESLFAVSQFRFTVKKAPRRADAPLRVYGGKDGVFVTCAGASLLGQQAALLLADENSAPIVLADNPDEDAMFKTLGKEDLKGAVKEIQEIFARARREGRKADALTDDERREIRRLEAEERVEQAQKARKVRPALTNNAVEVDRHTRRLQRLCQLIMRERRPYCPVNGLLVLVPFAGTDSDEDANQTGGVIQYDLATLRRAFRLNFPTFAMVCDIERVPGFHDFAERIPEDQRLRRVGQRFPLVPDLDADRYEPMVDGGVRFICNQLFPTWVYRLFGLEARREEAGKVVRGNVKLYQLMCHIRERQRRLSRILTRGIARQPGTDETLPRSRQGGAPLPMFGGCYLASASLEGGREPAFVAGVFDRLVKSQNFVSWTDEALTQDEQHHSFATRGYMILGVLAVAAVAGLGYWIFNMIGKGK
jgi:hypothetical protein